MTDYRYSTGSLAADYARGGFGLAVTAAPILLVDAHIAVDVVFGALAAVAAIFLARTGLRQLTIYRVDDTGAASVGPLGRKIRWDALTDLKLKYYSTRRDREQGWMQLTLVEGRTKLALESTLDGFEAIVDEAYGAAVAANLPLDETTLNNLQALGVAPADTESLAERWGVDNPNVRESGAGGGR